MRGRELNWGAMPLSGVFETTRRRAGAWSAPSRPIPLKDIGTALGIADLRERSALRRPTRCRWRTSRRCRRCSASASRPTPRRTGSARLEEQDLLCAPVRTLAEALADEQTAINGMIMRGAGRGRDACKRGRLADPHVGCAGDDPHSAGEARPAHRGGAGGARAGARDRGRVMPILLRGQGSRRARHDRPAGRAERDRRGDRARAADDLGRDRARPRRARRRADRRRRARLLDRRRHEGRQRRERARILGAAAAGRLRRHRAARDARRAGDRARQRPRGRRRLRDGARLRHRHRGRGGDASACPRRASAACRSTAA